MYLRNWFRIDCGLDADLHVVSAMGALGLERDDVGLLCTDVEAGFSEDYTVALHIWAYSNEFALVFHPVLIIGDLRDSRCE